MARVFPVRLPAPELIERYCAMGLWSNSTLTHLLDEGLLRNPDQKFKVWSSERPYDGTFGDVRDRALRLARGFLQRGVGPGDVVSFQLPNWIEAVVTFLATLYVGAISLPIVQIYGAKELRFVLAQTEAKLHVTTSRYRNFAYRESIDAMRPDLPWLAHVLYVDRDFPALGPVESIRRPSCSGPP
jgi:acyl-CoA synthetase